MAHFGSSRLPCELGKRSQHDDKEEQVAEVARKQQEPQNSNKTTEKPYIWCPFYLENRSFTVNRRTTSQNTWFR